jgi:hypothetical protein
MKRTLIIVYSICLFLLPACSMYDTRHTAPDTVVHSPKPLAVPVGKNWQIIEEAPKLTDERSRLPFQTEQSVQPEGTKTVSPTDTRKIDITR